MFKLSKNYEKKYKKRIEKQIYLAKESPEPVYDVSSCNLSEVPKAVFAYCKILKKEKLLLYDNKLKCLEEGMRDLHTLKILDLHSNLLTCLPKDIRFLINLKDLNISHNKLSHLSLELASLKHLQKLLINNNSFNIFPEVITSLSSLEHLDISHNLISSLPRQLHLLTSLTSLQLDALQMIYPDSSVCNEGPFKIMQFLCVESNVEYQQSLKKDICHADIPFTTTTISSSFPPPPITTTSLPPSPHSSPNFFHTTNSNNASSSESNINYVLLDYELLKEQRRLERLSLEQKMLQHQQQQTAVALQAANNKKQMMHILAEEHNRFNDEICLVQRKKTQERNNLIQSLHTVEENARNLVENFARTNEQARRTETLLDQMEKERLERERWYEVKKEEVDNLRKKDIAESFSRMLSNYDLMGELIRKYDIQKQESIGNSIAEMNEKKVMLDEKFSNLNNHKHVLIGKLLKEERMQKKAFEMLQYERDTCHVRVASQIRLVEDQLCQLTCLELDKKDIQLDSQKNVLNDNRGALTRLLRQLLTERKKREEELRKRLSEMEERSNTHQHNYWLVQYQRLLDSKPQHFIDETSRLDEGVVEVLERAGAGEFKPMFAHNRVSMKTLVTFKDDDLKQMGVSNASIRTQIMNVLANMTFKEDDTQAKLPLESRPSAPAVVKQGITSHSHFNSECVICLSEMSDILFLNCGHICTCQDCSQDLTHCPMDRIIIEQKIKIYVTA